MHTAGCGNVQVSFEDSPLTAISNVTYVPNLSTNLLSVSAVVNKGFAVIFRARGCEIFPEDALYKGKPVASAKCINGLYRLNLRGSAAMQSVTKVAEPQALNALVSPDIWHRRLGHLPRYGMDLLNKGMATGISFDKHDLQIIPTNVFLVLWVSMPANRSKIYAAIVRKICWASFTPTCVGP